jgi:SAM-dependent methyltransferase
MRRLYRTINTAVEVSMKRIHLIEIADEEWCPLSIRHAVTDYCRFVGELPGAYTPVVPLLARALQRTGARRVLDLGSGAAGPWLRLQPLLRESGVEVTVCLSDHNPDLVAFERARHRLPQALTFHPRPVDAAQVPLELSGFRTMFSAFHHLRPEQARAVLADAMARGEGIGLFEGGDRSLLTLGGLLGTPVVVLLVAPFIKPFRWSRLFWTYIIPVLPLVLLFDVIVSCLRLYSVTEMREMTAGLDGYEWEIGTVRIKPLPNVITYSIGIPGENYAKQSVNSM